MSKELNCPNCGPGHLLVPKTDGTGVCGTCQGTFTPGPEPKAVAIGEFDALEHRVAALEASRATPATPAEPEPKPADKPAEEGEPDV